jgi:hypothetical protein
MEEEGYICMSLKSRSKLAAIIYFIQTESKVPLRKKALIR